MTRLIDDKFSLGLETVTQLVRHEEFTSELAKAIRQQGGADRALKALTQEFFPVVTPNDLIHGRFTPLARKLEMVKAWPGITEEMLASALEEAKVSGRLGRYEAESPKNPLLEVVVTVYRESVPATLLYARNRMRQVFGNEKFSQWEDAYGQEVDDNRVRLLKDVPDHRDCVRIEVVDLGENLNRKDGFLPKDIRNAKSATFAPIYAAAQSSEWVRQMDGENVPYALCGGLELSVPGDGPWAILPYVNRDGSRASRLGGYWCDYRCHDGALPSLRE